MVDAGAFDKHARVELIDGLLCEMSPRTPAHERVIEYLTRTLAAVLDHDRYRLRVGSALSIGDSEPEPDVAVVRHGTPEPYHPASALLVIEVALSSRKRDLVVKPALYAKAGIIEYWVVDVERELVVVHRDPTANGYKSCVEIGREGILDGAVAEIGAIPVDAVLAAAAAR